MSIVAGVDFGTLSVRVSIFDSERGRLGAGMVEYPIHRKREDPDYATQSHADHMTALGGAMVQALREAAIDGSRIAALAVDTTGSTVIPVGADMQPLDDYYLWCDHRAWREAAEITESAHQMRLQAVDWSGGTYSSEWGFSKLLHWLRKNPDKRDQMVSAFEHCDYLAAVLCGVETPEAAARSICAMGHKWMWNADLGGLPSEAFLTQVDPLLAGVREKLRGNYCTSDNIAGHLSPHWAAQLGLTAGIPIPVGAFDAHWDAIGAGVRLGDVVNVIGTSTCIMAIGQNPGLIPGVCGVVKGSVHPGYMGIEAGLSATGDIFEAIARRADTTVALLSQGLEKYRAGETGLLRMTWDNGDRTVLVDPELAGITLGWRLGHTAQDELFAAIEGTAFHTRIILDRLSDHGVPIDRVINAGGISKRNETLNRIYANVLNKPVLVPDGDVTSLGSAIFAFLAAGTFTSVEEAQDALCPKFTTFEPMPQPVETYERLFSIYRDLYFTFGSNGVLPSLRRIAARVRRQ